jgi:hypothetical protein
MSPFTPIAEMKRKTGSGKEKKIPGLTLNPPGHLTWASS